MGLGRIFFFSITFGISIAIALKFGEPVPGLSFLFDSVNENWESKFNGLILLASLGLGIFSVFSMAKVFRQIIENRSYGVIVALLGFFGSIFTFGTLNFLMILVGIGLWVFGIIILTKSKY